MKVAIIGAGYTGLAAGVTLADANHEVTIFESENKPGGLAVGFKEPGWRWSLEKYYHHIFTSDKAIIKMAEKVDQEIIWKIPKTNTFINGREEELDSPKSLLGFNQLSLLSRIHMGLGLLVLKMIPNGGFLEKYRVIDTLPKIIGGEGYQKIWEPLLRAKFDKYADDVNLAWFWARVYKRSQKLGYFKGGFQSLADKMSNYIEVRGGQIKYGTKIGLSQLKGYDKIIITTPAPVAKKILGKNGFPMPKINYLNAQTLILELDQSLMKSYWLNILDHDFPFLVAVEHTNFMNKKDYGDKTIIYLGNYLTDEDPRLKLSKDELINKYTPYIKKINNHFKEDWIAGSHLFTSSFAQPVFPINFSQMIPSFTTNNPRVFIANMSMVYPWDRGTNYAIKLGEDVAKMCGD